jgi:hypothetical protein
MFAYLAVDQDVKCVAGFKVSEWLASGKYLEIEDLVTKVSERSRGYGGLLFDWLTDFAARQKCRQVRLLSAVRRADAHRFYKSKGMSLEAYYFSLNLGRPRAALNDRPALRLVFAVLDLAAAERFFSCSALGSGGGIRCLLHIVANTCSSP